VADTHSGTSGVVVAASLSSFRHTLPISLNGQLIQADSPPQSNANALTPAVFRHQ